MSDSVRPQRRQPTRLLRPWDLPGKSTGVGCHCLLWKRSLVFPICCFPLFALVTEEGFLISPCYFLKLCIQMSISLLFSFAFFFSSFHSNLHGLLRQPFYFLLFFLLGMVLLPVSYAMSRTSIHSSSGTLSFRSSPLNLFLTSTV